MKSETGVILVLFGSLFLASADNQFLIPLFPMLSDDLSTSIHQLGWLFSLYALSAAIFNLFLGPLTDRYGRVRFLFLGLSIFLVTASLSTQARSFSDLLLLRGVAGLAGGLLSTCTAGLVGDLFSYERRGQVMGVVLGSYFVALVLGIPIGSWLAETYGWRSVFWLSAGTAGCLILAGGIFLRATPSVSSRHAESGVRFWELLSRRANVAGLITSFLVSGGTLAFLTYISGHLSESFGLSAIQISIVFLVSGLGAGIASPLSGWLSDRFTKRKVFLVSNSALVIPLLLIDRLGSGVLLFTSLFLVSVCISFRQTSLQTLQTELVASPQRGAYLALRNTFSQLGISLAVLLAGQLYAGYGYGTVTMFAALLTLMATAVLFAFIKEPRSSRHHSPES